MTELPWAYRDWSYEATKETHMNAQKLMDMATAAEAKAKYYASLNSASGLDREQFLAREQYFNGQASGFRQAAWLVAQITGEANND